MKEGDAIWFTMVWSDAMSDHGSLLGEVIIQKKHYRVYLRNNSLKILDDEDKEITGDPELIREIYKITFKSLI